MRIVLAAAGSRGNVQPVVEIAAGLSARGHEVRLLVPRLFEAELAARGLWGSFLSTDAARQMHLPEDGLRSAQQALWGARKAMLEEFDALLPASAGADALVTTASELGATTVAEYRGIPHIRLGFVPFLSGDQPPPLQPLQGLPAAANRLLWGGVEAATSMFFGRPLNERRRALGLAPVRFFGAACAAYAQNLLAVDPLLAPPARGWKGSYRYVGYPFSAPQDLPEPLEAFLGAGPAPVYVGFGSVGVPDPVSVTRDLVEASGRAGCRLVLGQGWAGLGRGVRLPRHVFVAGEASHAALFPRLAAVVHHGGSGTTHEAARAGVAQVVVPQVADQHYWARRVWELGLGPQAQPLAGLSARRWTALLRSVLEARFARQARVLSALLATDGVQAAVSAIHDALAGRAAFGTGPDTARVVPIAALRGGR